jgi:hypothetical protein
MSYNVEQITLAVISDGNGDICGYSYKERQKLLKIYALGR